MINHCSSCSEKIDENQEIKYFSLGINNSKYLYCEKCGLNRIENLTKITETKWAQDFPQNVKSIEYYSHKGSIDTLKEAFKYDEDLKK